MTPPKYQRKVAHVSKIVQLVEEDLWKGYTEQGYRDRKTNTRLTKLQLLNGKGSSVRLFFHVFI